VTLVQNLNIKMCHLLDFLPSCSFGLHPWTPMEDFRRPNPCYTEPYHFQTMSASMWLVQLIVVPCVLIDFQCVTSVAVWIRTFWHRCWTVHRTYQYWYKNVSTLRSVLGLKCLVTICHIARENVQHKITALIHAMQH